jgi:hypothetical protein
VRHPPPRISGQTFDVDGFAERTCTVAPDGFGEFFLASSGAGGAFVGLLFVAVSIAPQRTFGDPAVSGAPRQQLAEGTFLTLTDGFVVSSIALIPGVNVGWFALVLGIGCAVIAGQLAWLLAQFHRHKPRHHASWRHLLRAVGPSMVATAVGAIEALVGLQLVLRPTDAAAWRDLALVAVGLYVLGIVRVWVLLGDPRHRWSGWLNPLQDPAVTREMSEPRDARLPTIGPGR